MKCGDIVKVDLEHVPKEQRECDEGTVIGLDLRFPRTPAMRKEMVLILFHKNYIKKKHWLTPWGVPRIRMESSDPRITMVKKK